MDLVIQYLESWRGKEHAENRLNMLISAYEIVRKDNRLQEWRYEPGRKRHGGGYNPMYCAFAATPFSGDDWFILRMVKGKDKTNPSEMYAIGFCLDYGKQDKRGGDSSIYTERRLSVKKDLKNIRKNNSIFLDAPFPESENRPHAYKGFEMKFMKPSTADELADRFIDTVLAWEKLFKSFNQS